MISMDSNHVKELFKFYDKMPDPRSKARCAHDIWREFEKFYGMQIEDLAKQLSYYKGDAVLAELILIRADIRKLLKENGK